MKLKDKNAVIFYIFICANLVDAAKIYLRENVYDDSDNLPSESTSMDETSSDNDEILLSSAQDSSGSGSRSSKEPITPTEEPSQDTEEVTPFVDQTRSENFNRIRRKTKHYYKNNDSISDDEYSKYLIVPIQKNNILLELANTIHKEININKKNTLTRFALDYYDDSSSAWRSRVGRTRDEMDSMTKAPPYYGSEENVSDEDSFPENDDSLDEEEYKSDIDDYRPLEVTQKFNEHLKTMPTVENVTTTEFPDYKISDEYFVSGEDQPLNHECNEDITPKPTILINKENRVLKTETWHKKAKEFNPTNRFEIVDNKKAPLKNKILIHGGSTEKFKSEEIELPKKNWSPKQKRFKKKKKSGILYLYMQGPQRLLDSEEYESNRKSSNQRLDHFMPKRYFWDADDYHHLGYFWFNGPQGKYPGQWRTPYR